MAAFMGVGSSFERARAMLRRPQGFHHAAGEAVDWRWMSDIDKARESAVNRGVGSYERHIFICTGPDCCTPEQGAESWAQLKAAAAKLNGSPERGRIYRTKVGCLRICDQGPTAVVYPEGTWYGGLTRDNVRTL